MSGYEQRPGDYRVLCDFSGFKCWASETVKTADGFRVLSRFAGQETQRHPQERVTGRTDRQTVQDPRPESEDTFLSATVLSTDL